VSESELDWEVRPYEEEDVASVRTLLQDAFKRDVEADLAEGLRDDGDAAIELVAAAADTIVGYIILSPMTSPDKSLGLGPVAVAPAHERLGIASSLIESSLALATAEDFTSVFLLGSPKFYERFGFSSEDASQFSSVYNAPYWQVTFLDEEKAPKSGDAIYAPAFRRFED